MDNIEEKLGSLLSNPQLMQQIMSMAQNPGGQPAQEAPPMQAPALPPDIDPGMLRKLSGLASQGTIDRNQQALLTALHPYLNRTKMEKLERAMRAAKMARLASGLLGQGGISLLTGR